MIEHGYGAAHRMDEPLLRHLGFTAWRETSHDQELYLGAVKLDEGAVVQAWVTCYPAQFFRFVVHTEEGDDYEIETGSGSFGQFWPTVDLVARDMVKLRAAH